LSSLRIFALLPTLALMASGVLAEPDILARFLASTQTLRADFRQELRDVQGQVLEVSSGTVLIKRPNRFQWLYQEPYEQLVVADGERLWVYEKDLGQASVAPISDALAATPAMLLSGERGVSEEFEVRASFKRDDLDWVLLAPKQASADFRSLGLAFRDDVLMFMELTDNLDQTTWIEFAQVELNPGLRDELFRFVPPEGVDVIGEAS
jgi:outer membrane lipoprotein carrier protein